MSQVITAAEWKEMFRKECITLYRFDGGVYGIIWGGLMVYYPATKTEPSRWIDERPSWPLPWDTATPLQFLLEKGEDLYTSLETKDKWMDELTRSIQDLVKRCQHSLSS